MLVGLGEGEGETLEEGLSPGGWLGSVFHSVAPVFWHDWIVSCVPTSVPLRPTQKPWRCQPLIPPP